MAATSYQRRRQDRLLRRQSRKARWRVSPRSMPPRRARNSISHYQGVEQGFRVVEGDCSNKNMVLKNFDLEGARALAVCYEGLAPGQTAAITTPTFSPREVLDMRTYDLMATPSDLSRAGSQVSHRRRSRQYRRRLGLFANKSVWRKRSARETWTVTGLPSNRAKIG